MEENQSEYEVSLQSAAAIIKNFPQEKYDLYLIGITRAGQWFHYDGEIEKISNDTWNQELLNPVTVCLEPERQAVMEIVDNKIIYQQIDAVLPVLHGKNGEDGNCSRINGACKNTSTWLRIISISIMYG